MTTQTLWSAASLARGVVTAVAPQPSVVWFHVRPHSALAACLTRGPARAQIYVVDSSDRRRVEETGVELNSLLEEQKLAGIPVLVLANKQDLINAMPAKEARGAPVCLCRCWQQSCCSVLLLLRLYA